MKKKLNKVNIAILIIIIILTTLALLTLTITSISMLFGMAIMNGGNGASSLYIVVFVYLIVICMSILVFGLDIALFVLSIIGLCSKDNMMYLFDLSVLIDSVILMMFIFKILPSMLVLSN